MGLKTIINNNKTKVVLFENMLTNKSNLMLEDTRELAWFNNEG